MQVKAFSKLGILFQISHHLRIFFCNELRLFHLKMKKYGFGKDSVAGLMAACFGEDSCDSPYRFNLVD